MPHALRQQETVSRAQTAACRLALGRFAFAAIVGFGNVAHAQEVDATAPATTVAPVVNILTQTAVKLGALTCAARVQQVTTRLGVTAQTRASLRRPSNPPDTNSFSIAMTVPVDGVLGLAVADFYPSSQACKADYALTVNLPDTCATVRANGFAGLRSENALDETITALSDQTNMRVFLVSSGAGCTVIKTETFD